MKFTRKFPASALVSTRFRTLLPPSLKTLLCQLKKFSHQITKERGEEKVLLMVVILLRNSMIVFEIRKRKLETYIRKVRKKASTSSTLLYHIRSMRKVFLGVIFGGDLEEVSHCIGHGRELLLI